MGNQARDRIAQDVTLIPHPSSIILRHDNALEQYTAPKQKTKCTQVTYTLWYLFLIIFFILQVYNKGNLAL